MAKVIIFSGIPGAGKTMLVKLRAAAAGYRPEVFSTDDYFMATGQYVYVREQQDEAHLWNLRRYLLAVADGPATRSDRELIVDNVNARVEHIAPYAQAARAFNFDLEILTLIVDPDFAHARNVHGVPLDSVRRMAKDISDRELPKTWPERKIFIPNESFNQR